MIILVTGSNGQLGSELKKISTTSTEHDWYFTDVDTLNICNKDDIELFFKDRKGEIVCPCRITALIINNIDIISF